MPKLQRVEGTVTEEIISVDCVDEFLWPRTLSYHLAARQQARTMDFSPNDRRSLALAEAKLMANYQLAAREGKKTLRRMEAELLRQSQAVQREDEIPAETGPAPEAGDDLDSMLSKVFAASTR